MPDVPDVPDWVEGSHCDEESALVLDRPCRICCGVGMLVAEELVDGGFVVECNCCSAQYRNASDVDAGQPLSRRAPEERVVTARSDLNGSGWDERDFFEMPSPSSRP